MAGATGGLMTTVCVPLPLPADCSRLAAGVKNDDVVVLRGDPEGARVVAALRVARLALLASRRSFSAEPGQDRSGDPDGGGEEVRLRLGTERLAHVLPSGIDVLT